MIESIQKVSVAVAAADDLIDLSDERDAKIARLLEENRKLRNQVELLKLDRDQHRKATFTLYSAASQATGYIDRKNPDEARKKIVEGRRSADNLLRDLHLTARVTRARHRRIASRRKAVVV
jgi:hypothetical protein